MKIKSSIVIFLTVIILLLSGCGLFANNAQPVADSEDIQYGLTVYFIDVGQADSALVVCDGAAMLIDGGNAADSDLIYAFLDNHGISHFEYIIATHAHEDHIGGLSGALNYASVGTAYCPVPDNESRAFLSFVKYLGEQGKAITAPSPGDTFMLGGAFNRSLVCMVLFPQKNSKIPRAQ